MRVGVALAVFLTSCAEERRPPPAVQTSLPPGVAARAGGEDVTTATVLRIAREQGVGPLEARERAITDALFAARARSTPEYRAAVSAAERAVLARALLEGIRDRARGAGPVTDAELATLTAERWVELDRPPSARVAHAVVLVKKPEDDAPARALAERLAAALRGAKDGAELVRRAKAFSAGALTITAEHLPPCTLDGRTWDSNAVPPAALGGNFDLDFARAANALEKPGDQSGVVKTAFGYHVIQLEERYPEQRESPEARRSLLWDAVIARRAKPELDALAARLRAQTRIELERAADELTALVPVSAPPVAP
ncbi:MAG TPA: peptidyl-prolyl cis-trans isomerase [Polyangiaceae bacterium]